VTGTLSTLRTIAQNAPTPPHPRCFLVVIPEEPALSEVEWGLCCLPSLFFVKPERDLLLPLSFWLSSPKGICVRCGSVFASFCETSSHCLPRHLRQKYISKERKILDRKKVSSKHHDLPRNSPQLHHNFTTIYHHETPQIRQNPPQKRPSTTKTIFPDSQPEKPSG
jgi:hypothetical protein